MNKNINQLNIRVTYCQNVRALFFKILCAHQFSEDFVKSNFQVSRSRGWSKFLHFKHAAGRCWCCWSIDHNFVLLNFFILGLHAFVRNNTKRSHIPFMQIVPMIILCTFIEKLVRHIYMSLFLYSPSYFINLCNYPFISTMQSICCS